jgi:thymidylate synthase (FAD)
VLDRSFVRVIDYMGDDAAIVQAARLSYPRPPPRVF